MCVLFFFAKGVYDGDPDDVLGPYAVFEADLTPRLFTIPVFWAERRAAYMYYHPAVGGWVVRRERPTAATAAGTGGLVWRTVTPSAWPTGSRAGWEAWRGPEAGWRAAGGGRSVDAFCHRQGDAGSVVVFYVFGGGLAKFEVPLAPLCCVCRCAALRAPYHICIFPN